MPPSKAQAQTGLDWSPGEMVRNCQQETLVQQCNDKRLGEFPVRYRRGL